MKYHRGRIALCLAETAGKHGDQAAAYCVPAPVTSGWRRLAPVLLLTLPLVIQPVMAEYRRYQPELEQSQWAFRGNRLQCQLTQSIPQFGLARFRTRAGQPNMRFSLETLRDQPQEFGRANMDAQVPLWRPEQSPHSLGSVRVAPGKIPVTLRHDRAWRLLAELEQGFDPAFRYADWIDGRDTVVVAMSSANFGPTYQNFLKCVGDLLPFDFRDIRHTELHFAFDSAQFLPVSRARLERIRLYLKEDKRFDVVLVAGHTDNRGKGRYNMGLSRRRAEAVKKFLVSSGLPSNRIRVSAFGETRPIASNSNPVGRARNRRVIIDLLK